MSDNHTDLNGKEKIERAVGEVVVEDGPGDLEWIMRGLQDRDNDRMLLDGLDVRVDKWKVKMILVDSGNFFCDDSGRWHYGERKGENKL